MTLPDNQVTAILLGTMQDGGLPHICCRCSRCAAAYQNPHKAEYAACLALVDKRATQPIVWLIDATPDIKWQLDLLAFELGQHPHRTSRIRQPGGVGVVFGVHVAFGRGVPAGLCADFGQRLR